MFLVKKRGFAKQRKLIFGLFLVVTFLSLFIFFIQNVSPKVVHIATKNMEKYIDTIASNYQIFLDERATNEECFELVNNSKGEIINVSYNMACIYNLASKLTEFLQSSLENTEQITSLPYMNHEIKKQNLKGILLDIPVGIISDSPFLVNIGPKIPVFIHFMNSVFTNVQTRITDYGINNAMLEIYLHVTISYEVVLPVTTKEEEKSYEFLLDTQLIQGKVPDWYNKNYEAETTFFELYFP